MNHQIDNLAPVESDQLTQVSAVVITAKGETITIGRNQAELPRATSYQSRLSHAAQEDLYASVETGVALRLITQDQVTPVDYQNSLTILPHNQGGDNVLVLAISDSSGNNVSALLRERELLAAATQMGTHFCQSRTGEPVFSLVCNTINPNQPAAVILFKAESSASGNAAETAQFLKDLISNLVIQDSILPPQQQRGYINALSGDRRTAKKGQPVLKALLSAIYTNVDDAMVTSVKTKLSNLIFVNEKSGEVVLPLERLDTLSLPELFTVIKLFSDRAQAVIH